MTGSSVDVPQELVDEILSHFKIVQFGITAVDTAPLVSSSLVCRSWLTSSRRILFQQVSLTKYNIDGLRELLTSNPDLAFYIRGIGVRHSGPEGKDALLWLNSVSWIFGQVERLERLSMTNITWPAADEDTKAYFCNQLSHVLPTVTHLRLYRMIFSNQLELEHFILAFPNLKSVVCTGTAWDQSSSPAPFIHHLRPQNPPITSIRLEWEYASNTVLDTLCQNPNTKLEEFGIHMRFSADVPRLCHLLQLYKTSLRKLYLRGMSDTMVELDRVLQRTAIPLNLDLLSLGDATADKETNRWMLSTILALSSSKLRTLTMRVLADSDNMDWNAVDRILSNNDTFSALTTLNVCLYLDWRLENPFSYGPKIKLLMPNLSSRPRFEISNYSIEFDPNKMIQYG